MNVALKENTHKGFCSMHSILTKIDQVIFSLDTISGEYIHISPSCEAVYGYNKQEFIASPLLWMDLIHPEDTSIIKAYELKLAKAKLSSTSIE